MTRPAASAAGPQEAPRRLVWLDHVRAALTVLVVAHHAAQAYGPTGGAWPVANETRSPLLGVFIAVNAMFFMSVFFFVSGYFTPATFTRKGTRGFLRDRLLRLGVPSLLVLLATGALMERPQFLHLWFVVDLLALNGLYALAMSVTPHRDSAVPPPRERDDAPMGGRLLLVALLLAAGTAVVRLRFPVDRWVDLLGVLPVEPAHAVHYAGAFIAGLVAARTRWVERFSDRLGASSLALGGALVLGYAAYRLWPDRTTTWFVGGGASWYSRPVCASPSASACSGSFGAPSPRPPACSVRSPTMRTASTACTCPS
jgi:hypothetical protein